MKTSKTKPAAKAAVTARLDYFTPEGKKEQIPVLLIEKEGARNVMLGQGKVRAIVEVLDNIAEAEVLLRSVLDAPRLTIDGKPVGDKPAAKPGKAKPAAAAPVDEDALVSKIVAQLMAKMGKGK
jgi:hypothetical protein